MKLATVILILLLLALTPALSRGSAEPLVCTPFVYWGNHWCASPEEQRQANWVGVSGQGIAEDDVPGNLKPYSTTFTTQRVIPRVVLFIHGISAGFGSPSTASYSDWTVLEGRFSEVSFEPWSVVKLAYYGGECDANDYAVHMGGHDRWFPSGHVSAVGCNGISGGLVHGLNTDIRHLAWHVGNYIVFLNQVEGVTPSIVAHSLGGLIVRYAVQMSAISPEWPPIAVNTVVTLGTPHGGSNWLGCDVALGFVDRVQVVQMCDDPEGYITPNSSPECDSNIFTQKLGAQCATPSNFISWLRNNAANPQNGASGMNTRWTTIGAEFVPGIGDGVVSIGSHHAVAAQEKWAYPFLSGAPCNYSHTEYYRTPSEECDPFWSRDANSLWSSASYGHDPSTMAVLGSLG